MVINGWGSDIVDIQFILNVQRFFDGLIVILNFASVYFIWFCTSHTKIILTNRIDRPNCSRQQKLMTCSKYSINNNYIVPFLHVLTGSQIFEYCFTSLSAQSWEVK